MHDDDILKAIFADLAKPFPPDAISWRIGPVRDGKTKPLSYIDGDVLDMAKISRHAPIGWENQPDVVEEIEEGKARLEEISTAAKDAAKIWTLGNHDARFETRLATVAPEYAMVHGVHLKDHFPEWTPAWALWINDSVVVKHRFKGGIHAAHNNVVWSGKTIVTGHLHSQKVQPFTDYNGDRWGVDCGTLADIYGPHATDYMEDNPRNWRSGWCALRFRDKTLLQPQLARVFDEDHIDFLGEVHRV